MTQIARGARVLVILCGGNIGLISKKDRNRETVLVSASLAEIKRELLGTEQADTLLLQEGNLAGRTIHVDFHDLRESSGVKYRDPEEFDSAQVRPKLWLAIAKKIKDEYEHYEGFVVLHGLDTMAYTASALSFMLENLQAPIVFTGAQRPLDFARTDAKQNIYSAITFAASQSLGIRPVINEVVIYSYDTLFRGNRASMASASSYRSFDSPNFRAIATAGEHIQIESHLVHREDETRVLMTRGDEVDAPVVILDVFPGMDADVIKGVNSRGSRTRGVLLRTYGMGTAPTSDTVLDAIRGLTNSGIIVMNVTQARSGRISHGTDPVSLRLFEQGVISGVDMTAEAAYAKMVALLSERERNESVADWLQIEGAGEQSQSIYNIHFQSNETREDEAGSGYCRAFLRAPKSVVGVDRLKRSLREIDNIQLRLLGLEPASSEDKHKNWSTEIDICLVDPDTVPDTTAIVDMEDRVVATVKVDTLRWFSRGRETINYTVDLSDFRDRLLSKDRIPSTIVRIVTHMPVRWRAASIAIFAP